MPAKKTTTKRPKAKKAAPKAKEEKPEKKTGTLKESPRETGALSAPVYDAGGKKLRTLTLPENIFGAPKNDALVYQVVTAMEANARTKVAHTKTRGDVRGGGKKPWRQKGTGRARHGSRRSPIWRGGGITFGPRNEKSYAQKINRKMRARALATVLSQKFAAGEILFVDSFVFTAPKTKDAKASLISLAGVQGYETLATRRNNAALIALGTADVHVKKSFRNMGHVLIEESRNINPVDILKYRFLLVANPEASLEAISKRMK